MESVIGVKRARGQTRESVGLVLAFAPWLLVGATPVLFAAATWDSAAGANDALATTRLFGAPVLLVELTIIVLAFARGWRPVETFKNFPKIALPLIGALLLVQCYTVAFAAPKPLSALIWSYITVLHGFFGLAVASLASDAEIGESRVIWPIVVAGICAYCLMLIAFVLSAHPAKFDWQYLGFGVANLRQVGYYSIVGCGAAFGCSVQRRGMIRAAFVGGACLAFAVAVWSGSRGAVLAISLGLLTALVLVPAGARLVAFTDALIVLTGGATLSALAPSPTHLYGIGRIVSSSDIRTVDVSSGRVDLWRGAWHAFLQRPLFGHGEGQFGWVVRPQAIVYMHPHNIALQLLFQWGIVGTAIFGALAMLIARASVRAVCLAPQMSIPPLVIMMSVIALSFCDGALFHVYPVMMFTFSVATLIGLARPHCLSGSVGEHSEAA